MHSPLDGPIGREALDIIGTANGVVISTPPGYRETMRDPTRIVVFTSAVAFAEWAKRHFETLMKKRLQETGPQFAGGRVGGDCGANKVSGT
jgi:hypothetical protein